MVGARGAAVGGLHARCTRVGPEVHAAWRARGGRAAAEHALSSGAATGGRAGGPTGRGVQATAVARCWVGGGGPSGGGRLPEAGHCGVSRSSSEAASREHPHFSSLVRVGVRADPPPAVSRTARARGARSSVLPVSARHVRGGERCQSGFAAAGEVAAGLRSAVVAATDSPGGGKSGHPAPSRPAGQRRLTTNGGESLRQSSRAGGVNGSSDVPQFPNERDSRWHLVVGGGPTIPRKDGVSRVSDLWNARRNNGTGHNSIPAGLPV